MRWIQPITKLFGIRRIDDLDWPEDQRAALLANARTAIRLGFFHEAEAILAAAAGGAGDVAYLNLLGVIHESRREWKTARRYYGKAIHADRAYIPAQQNMRRLYELNTFGRCADPVSLGDGRPVLAMLLEQVHHSGQARRPPPATMNQPTCQPIAPSPPLPTKPAPIATAGADPAR